MAVIVLAEYLFATAGHSYTAWQLKGVAAAGYTVATLRESKHYPAYGENFDLLTISQWLWRTQDSLIGSQTASAL